MHDVYKGRIGQVSFKGSSMCFGVSFQGGLNGPYSQEHGLNACVPRAEQVRSVSRAVPWVSVFHFKVD